MTGELNGGFKFSETLRTLFDHAGKLFALEFHEAPDTRADMRAFSVLDSRTHNEIGALRFESGDGEQKTTFSAAGESPAAIVHINVPGASSGEDPVLSMSDVQAVFKLSGHAFHFLLSQPGAKAGTESDFVELPPDFLEQVSFQADAKRIYDSGSGIDPAVTFQKFRHS